MKATCIGQKIRITNDTIIKIFAQGHLADKLPLVTTNKDASTKIVKFMAQGQRWWC